MTARGRDRLALVVLAALAYLPALASSPGRMPADTKLYLYLDPGGLLGRAASTFEAEQFAGWVPHQQVTYLWPSGPWFWLFDALGTPDWIAHRLWIGTILFAAGAGAYRVARLLGIGPVAAMAGGALYELSPYLLAYISRTSLLLLPWAGLGWIVAATIAGASRRPSDTGSSWRGRLTAWREPAIIALIVATVGGVNATALALIIPGPVLWLIHAAANGSTTWKRVIGFAVRTGVLCAVISAWWVAMTLVQSRSGAPVLAYSETLRDVSRNSTGSEVLRSLGYWLFYQRDPAGPTTTASLDYLVSGRAILISYAVSLVALVGLWLVNWPHRRFAAWLIAVGALLAVGVHPIDAPSPLVRLFAGGDETSTIALALRSSTRATPLIVLGLALGAGALVAALPARVPGLPASVSPPWRAVGAALLVLLVIANLPSIWRFDLVDPAIDRDAEPPPEWVDAAAELNAAAPDSEGGRVLQLPGAEFGAFRWGYTVDQPLVALVDRPLITRDLLPLGSGASMDLLYALDDRFQEGWIEPASVPAVARLLGADVIWLTGDAAFDRFRTARPEVVIDLLADDVDGLGEPRPFGTPRVNVGDVETLDETAVADARVGAPIAPVVVVEVDDPLGIVRTATASQVISGSGDGIIDTAAAGLLEPDAVVRYSLSLEGAALADAIAEAGGLTVTDSNRDRAHHWRGSQDVHGHTEPGGSDDDVLDSTAADQRLAPFDTSSADQQTIAIQEGPVTATASSYGEPFAYRPEDRAVMAIDGDPTTAWVVGDHGDPTGERLQLTVAEATDGNVNLRQVAPRPGGRVIERIDVRVDHANGDGAAVSIHLDERSWTPDGQDVTIAPLSSGTTVEFELSEVSAGDDAVAASRGGVGFIEVDLGLGPTVEYVRPPVDGLEHVDEEPLSIVFTRLRVDPLDVWRSDPEPELQRQVPLPRQIVGDVEITVRADARAPDDVVAGLFGDGANNRPALDAVPLANRRLTGSIAHRGAAASDGDLATSWITPFDEAVGSALQFAAVDPLDQIELVQPAGPYSKITALRLSDGAGSLDVDVPAPDEGGRSQLRLPRVLDGPLTVEVVAIDPATTVDRRYGDVRTLPAAISELVGVGVRPLAADNDVVGWTCDAGALIELDGRPVGVEFESTVGTLTSGGSASARPCEGTEVVLDEGTHRWRTDARTAGLTVDRIAIVEPRVETDVVPPPSVRVIEDEPRQRVVEVGACPDGCWLVLGEGYNEAWQASVDGGRVDGPELVDGGFNGWWLEPATDSRIVVLRWTAQWPVTLGLAISLAAVAFCLLAIVATRRSRPAHHGGTAAPVPSPDRPRLGSFGTAGAPRRLLPAGVTLTAASAILIAPEWGLVAAGAAVLAALIGRSMHRPLEAIGVAAAITVAIQTYWIERRDAPLPTAGWTEHVDHLNRLALFAVLALAAGASFDTTRRVEPGRGATAPDDS